jgi:hypothetical protein
MSLILLLASTALWILSAQGKPHSRARIASVVQTVGVIVLLFSRNDLPPSGWVSLAQLGALLPGLWLAWKAAVHTESSLYVGQAALTFGTACWAGLAPGAGVIIWPGWAIPHIALAVIGFGTTALAALFALHLLQGRRTGLLLAAVLLTALPLLGPRASAVQVYYDGDPVTADCTIENAAGAQGIVRTVSARAKLPWERPLRLAACAVLLLAFAVSIVCSTAKRGAHIERLLIWLAVAGLSAHVLLLSSSLFPRGLGIGVEQIEEHTIATLTPELHQSQSVGAIELPTGPFTGGPGSPGIPLPIAGFALALTILALRPASTAVPGLREQRASTVAILALLGTAATGLLWASYAWGGPSLSDPKLFAVVVASGLLGVSRLAASDAHNGSKLSSWLVLLSFGVLLLSMLGPETGWIAPTLHHFGP